MEWISVNDRLPNLWQWVLIVYKTSTNQCLKIEIAYLGNFFGYRSWYPSEHSYKTVKGVTHWMPLPKPPEELIMNDDNKKHLNETID